MKPTSFATGRQAETVAAQYLERKGFTILQQNWRTRYCEIDIVAKCGERVYFVEVKYRRSSQQGAGLAYITAQKLRRMQFAAELWVKQHGWTGPYQLAAIEVSGTSFAVTNFVDEL